MRFQPLFGSRLCRIKTAMRWPSPSVAAGAGGSGGPCVGRYFPGTSAAPGRQLRAVPSAGSWGRGLGTRFQTAAANTTQQPPADKRALQMGFSGGLGASFPTKTPGRASPVGAARSHGAAWGTRGPPPRTTRAASPPRHYATRSSGGAKPNLAPSHPVFRPGPRAALTSIALPCAPWLLITPLPRWASHR